MFKTSESIKFIIRFNESTVRISNNGKIAYNIRCKLDYGKNSNDKVDGNVFEADEIEKKD